MMRFVLELIIIISKFAFWIVFQLFKFAALFFILAFIVQFFYGLFSQKSHTNTPQKTKSVFTNTKTEAGTKFELYVYNHLRRNGFNNIFHDVKIEVDGKRSQNDIVVIEYGNMYIIECKNWSGNVSGDDNSNLWSVFSNNSFIEKKYGNPTWQNSYHVRMMHRFLEYNNIGYIPIFSIIVFGDMADITDVYCYEKHFITYMHSLCEIIYSTANYKYSADSDTSNHIITLINNTKNNQF